MLFRLLLLPLAGCLSWNYTGEKDSADLDSGETGDTAETGDSDIHDGDLDGDGELSVADGGADCWDDPASIPDGYAALNGLDQPTAADVHPGAEDAPYDGVDADCAGGDDFDADGDGHASSTWPDAGGETGDDCYDIVTDTYPTPDSTCAPAPATLTPAEIHPGATDAPYDATDADCAGDEDADADGDGFDSCSECDDSDDTVNPDAVETIWYDGVDQDCDGNDGDQDGDGYYAADYEALTGVPVPEAYHPDSPDCWDDPTTIPTEDIAIHDMPQLTAAEVYPGAEDPAYDAIDSACDGGDDFDADGDGHASDALDNREGAIGDDCADDDASISPDATEIWYDDIDQNCDGNDDDQDGDGTVVTDDCDDTAADVTCTWYYEDTDGDGYGGNGDCLCAPDATFDTLASGDCDDGDTLVHPKATEAAADGVDSDCDGLETCWSDVDGDGFGQYSASSSATFSCIAPGVSDNTDDCDDTDAASYPGAVEVAGDGVDEDCDGGELCYRDDDKDFYGTDEVPGSLSCGYSGEATVGGDCDDSDSRAHPGARELPADGSDRDCDGYEECYEDADGDGFGSGTTIFSADLSCETVGVSSHATDCNDADVTIYLGAPELCDGQENGCVGLWLPAAEDGLVAFETTTGSWSDATEMWAGDGVTVSTIAAENSGTWHVCSGDWLVALTTATADGLSDHDIRVDGHEGSSKPRINASSSGLPALYAHSATMKVTGVDLIGGDGFDPGTGNTYGGLAYADGADAVTEIDLDNVEMSGGIAVFGGAVAAGGAGAIYTQDSMLQFNFASIGGAFYTENGTIILTDSMVYANLATYGGGGAVDGEGAAGCYGSTSLKAGLDSNAALSGGGGVWLEGTASVFDATDCDIKGNVAGTIPVPNSVASPYMDYVTEGDDLSIICDWSGCS